MSVTASILQERIDKLERQAKKYRIGLIASAAAAVLAAGAATTEGAIAQASPPQVLRLKGLIIEDAQGRPRIVMGAPTPAVTGRDRRDPLTGLVYLDENGADRLTFGAYPDPMLAAGPQPRRVPGAGILIHDRDGVERGGYGVLDDGTAAVTVDWPKTGEGAVMSAGERFAGMGAFHRSEPGVYREAVTIGAIRDGEEGFVKLTDGGGNQRLRVQMRGRGEPQLTIYDREGRSLRTHVLR
ncbi:MAG TPA: hypothetical protein VF704_03465 [Allosphingosinicella sp.]